MEQKTNVMRLLEINNIEYTSHCYIDTGAVSGEDVARAMGQEPDKVFKTLVAVGKTAKHFVFVIPVKKTLDLKKAAAASREKWITLITQKELLPLTGYIHGGCSPIGMKKQFKTFFDETIILYDSIIFSAGKIGYQVEVSPNELYKLMDYENYDLCE